MIGLTTAYFNLPGKTPVLRTALQMYVNPYPANVENMVSSY